MLQLCYNYVTIMLQLCYNYVMLLEDMLLDASRSSITFDFMTLEYNYMLTGTNNDKERCNLLSVINT